MATKKKWSAKVDTDSTHPDEGLFKKSASAIAKALASKKVSPKGPASGMQMLNFYINRAGKNLSQEPATRNWKKRRPSSPRSSPNEKPESEKPAKKNAAKKPAKRAAKKAPRKTPAKSPSKKSIKRR